MDGRLCRFAEGEGVTVVLITIASAVFYALTIFMAISDRKDAEANGADASIVVCFLIAVALHILGAWL